MSLERGSRHLHDESRTTLVTHVVAHSSVVGALPSTLPSSRCLGRSDAVASGGDGDGDISCWSIRQDRPTSWADARRRRRRAGAATPVRAPALLRSPTTKDTRSTTPATGCSPASTAPMQRHRLRRRPCNDAPGCTTPRPAVTRSCRLRVGIHTGEPARRRRRSSTSAWPSSLAARLCAVAVDRPGPHDRPGEGAGRYAAGVASFSSRSASRLLKGVEDPVSIWGGRVGAARHHRRATGARRCRLASRAAATQSTFAGTAHGAVADDGSLEVRGGGPPASSSSSPANQGIGRSAPGSRGGQARQRRRRNGPLRALRRGPRHPVPTVRRGRPRSAARPSSPSSSRGTSRPTAASSAASCPTSTAAAPDAPAPQPAEPDTERFRLFEAIVGSAGAGQARSNPLRPRARRPALGDQAHDTCSFRRLAEEPNPLPLMVVGTYRSSDITAEHPLVRGDRRPAPPCRRHSPSPSTA